MLISELMINSAYKFPFKDAVISEQERVNYFDLLDLSGKFAFAAKKAGMNPGERIVLYIDNSIGYVVSYFGCLMAGGVVVGQSTANKERHLKNIINHCEATGIVTSGRHIQTALKIARECPSLKFVFYDDKLPNSLSTENIQLREMLDIYSSQPTDFKPMTRDEEELAQIIYTSGTTGNPKGVMLSHKNLNANTQSIIQYLGLSFDDRVMAVLPFYYSYGNSLLLTHVACGGSIVIDNRFAYPQKVLQRMVEENVTGFAGVPSTFAVLAHKAGLKNFDLSNLRYITQAGGPMSPALADELRGALPDTRIYIMYGQTEASARLSYLEPEMLTKKSGSIGKAIPGVTLKVKNEMGLEVAPGETGEIIASGDNIMMGYWKNEDDTRIVLKPDGLHTGDLATIDEDGYLYIVSRKSDMIKSGAHRISPKEIEELIMEDERVHEVAVIGEPDEILGEAIVAVIVARPGAVISEAEILKFCNKHLPHYKIPRRLEFKESLTKTASGKVKKHELKNELTKV